MKNVYHIFTHPNLDASRVNKAILEVFTGKDGIETRMLYQEYPDWKIDIEREKSSLTKADIVVVQTPFYWYSTPGLFKEWEDRALEYGFAYGEGGDKLKGKKFLIVLSTFGPEESYRSDGYNHFTVEELLRPLEQTANLCGMEYLKPMVLNGVARKTDDDIAAFGELVAQRLEELRR